ncbi:intron-encoded nuclease [Staphylococcus phage PG-2021_1]|uniref:Uncharacterized protein n=1 Tax=Staphylococcus phage 110 TaxID=3038194 RepID=A0AAX3Y2U1_9CAUD|nr:hypothetical protein BESEP4_00090 [Staphylococcus phage vB_SepM_BE04]WJJ58188.1 intron encoded nuclease [Staphylococcus phage 110]
MDNKTDIKIVKTKGSIGEQLIDNIFSYNNINYKREYAFKNKKGTTQRMDFYVLYKSKKYCVEFNGEQHYINTSWDNLEKVQELDNLKKQYCIDNDIIFVEIPYTEIKPNKLIKALNKYFLNLKLPESFFIDKGIKINIKEFLDYYSCHTAYETGEEFGIEEYRVKNLIKNLDYNPKRIPKEVIKVFDEDDKLVLEGAYHEIKEKLDLQMSNVIKCLNGDMNQTQGYYFRYLDKSKELEREKRVKERKIKNKGKTGSSKKRVYLLNVITEEEFKFNSIKDCYVNMDLNKDKVYKLFNPKKNLKILDKYIGRKENEKYPLSREEALKIINK